MLSIKRILISVFFATLAMAGFVRPALAISGDQLAVEINNYRVSNNLRALTPDARLLRSSSAKLADIGMYHYWSHANPVTHTKWWSTIEMAGYYGKIGENLARGYDSESSVMEAWLASPSHRANLLNPAFRRYGIAVGDVDYTGSIEQVVVLHFGN